MSANAVTPAAAIRLTAFQRRVLEFVESKRNLSQGVCLSTETLAKRFGVSVRYVQLTIQRLRQKGLIAREWDYSLRTRRRFRVGAEAPSVSALECAQSAHSSALTTCPPLEPPNRSLESLETEIGKRGTPPPRNSPRTPTRPSEPPPVPEPVRDLAARVAKVAGEDPTLSTRLAGLTRTWAVEWVEAAVGRLERKSEREAVTSPVGFLVRTLQGFGRDGGPPAPPPREPSLRDLVPEFEWTPELLERREQWLERIRREGQVAPQDPTKFGAYRAPEREPVKPTRVDDATRRRYMELQARMGSVPAACRVTSVQDQLKRISWL